MSMGVGGSYEEIQPEEECGSRMVRPGDRQIRVCFNFRARTLVIAMYAFLIVICIGTTIELYTVFGKCDTHLVGWYVAGYFVLMSLPMSAWDITQHLLHYRRPERQRYIIRILWMVPIYAVESWLSLRFKDASVFIASAREFCAYSR